MKAAGFQRMADPSLPVACGDVEIGFDKASGAVNHLVDSSGAMPVTWASADRTLLRLGYRTYSQQDFQIFQNQ